MKETGIKQVALAGGVAANDLLRETLKAKADVNNFNSYIPSLEYCTDNAAMIAMAGYYNYLAGKYTNDLALNARASINIEEE